jgi:hypothetical protein
MMAGVTGSGALHHERYAARRDIGLLQVALAARANDLGDRSAVAMT